MRKGKLIARLGGKDGPGLEPGKFIAPHGLALDSKGDIYVGEVSYTNWKTSFPDTPMPRGPSAPCRSWRSSQPAPGSESPAPNRPITID